MVRCLDVGGIFNREAFGEYTDCLFAMRLPVDGKAGRYHRTYAREHAENWRSQLYSGTLRTFCMNHYGVPDLSYCFCIGSIRNMKVNFFSCTCLDMGQDVYGLSGLERISLFFRESDSRKKSELLAGCSGDCDRNCADLLQKALQKKKWEEKVDQYEPVPTKIKGKKPPKWDDRLFKNR